MPFWAVRLTGGSTAVRDAWEKLRKAGASARMMLVAAAASEWGVDASQLKAANGMVTGPGGKKATYGQLAAKAATMEVPKDVPLKPIEPVQGGRQHEAETPRYGCQGERYRAIRYRYPRARHALRRGRDGSDDRRQGRQLRRYACQVGARSQGGGAIQPRCRSGGGLVLAGQEGQGSAADPVGCRSERRQRPEEDLGRPASGVTTAGCGVP